MAELADAHGSGPCPRKWVGVQLPPAALFGGFEQEETEGTELKILRFLCFLLFVLEICSGKDESGQAVN